VVGGDSGGQRVVFGAVGKAVDDDIGARRASSSATPRPIPEFDPVTIARLPFRVMAPSSCCICGEDYTPQVRRKGRLGLRPANVTGAAHKKTPAQGRR
jgi:hypothetical protein